MLPATSKLEKRPGGRKSRLRWLGAPAILFFKRLHPRFDQLSRLARTAQGERFELATAQAIVFNKKGFDLIDKMWTQIL
jgi:hypothetical protein